MYSRENITTKYGDGVTSLSYPAGFLCMAAAADATSSAVCIMYVLANAKNHRSYMLHHLLHIIVLLISNNIGLCFVLVCMVLNFVLFKTFDVEVNSLCYFHLHCFCPVLVLY
jgi:hypothetical protein